MRRSITPNGPERNAVDEARYLGMRAYRPLSPIRLGLKLNRRELFLWIVSIFFLNQISTLIFEAASLSPERIYTNIGAISIFHFMAWYVIFHFIIQSDPLLVARRRDLLFSTALCFILFLPTAKVLWVATSGMAVYWVIFNAGDPKLRAAGVVLAALSVQALWGHIFFRLVAFPLLCAETAVVGTILGTARAGTVWQDNVITGPSGFGIVIFDECSVFHNLSLAMLCWVTVSKIRREQWMIYDLIIGLLVGVTMILFNICRLCIMSWNIDLYNYWHHGTGAEIFAIGASLSILLISLYGSRPIRPLT